MAHRPIIEIDQAKCDGCGKCVTACAEGAIQLVDGKARLVSEVYCDGLGACLGECPRDAIRIIEREAAAFDAAAVAAHLQPAPAQPAPCPGHACPGSRSLSLARPAAKLAPLGQPAPSHLTNWPVQLTLVNPQAPWLHQADLLLVADCVPFAFAGFHAQLLRGRPVIIGCPKLDDAPAYVEKLAAILRTAAPRSLTVVHMEVPCCRGLARIAQLALLQAASPLTPRLVIIGIDGRVVADDHGVLTTTA
jgi:Pyruvate/2-oxoacid:ferredoxin oxidoreductase delta subunit